MRELQPGDRREKTGDSAVLDNHNRKLGSLFTIRVLSPLSIYTI